MNKDMNEEMYKKIKEEYGELYAKMVKKIIAEKKKKRVSQSELYRRTGVPQKTISRMENGLSLPSLKTIEKLMDGLGLKMDVIFLEK